MEKNKNNMAVDLHIFYSTAVIMLDAFDSMCKYMLYERRECLQRF